MSTETLIILIAIGIVTGFLSGLFGVGGGLIIVPSLLGVYSLNHFDSPYTVHVVIATSLFIIIFTSLTSAHKHFLNGNVVWKAALFIGISSALMVFLFSKIAIMMPGDILKKIFSAVLIIIAVKMILDKKSTQNLREKNDSENFNNWKCLIIGTISGAIAAFSGLGGGVFVVPLMHYFLKMPFKKAIGTSSAAILITAVAGVLSYLINSPAGAITIPYSFGMVDMLSAIPIIVASVPLSRLGVYVNKKMHHYLLSKLFAFFIIIVSLKLIFF